MAVTLYGENAGPLTCSSTTKIVGHLATCYDSSWVFYSIDGCLPPNSSSTRVSSAGATAVGVSAAHVASTTSVPRVQTGIIVGGTVAGFSVVILGVAGVWLILRHRRRKSDASKLTHELSDDRALVESDAAAEKHHPKELWGDHAAVEIGRNSRYEGVMRDAALPVGWRVNPGIQVRFVP